MPRREHIPCPYEAYNGATITCQAHIKSYNDIQDDINRWIDAGRKPPEYLLDFSHQTFVMISTLAKEQA